MAEPPDAMAKAAHEAAMYASRLDFHLLGAASMKLDAEARRDNLLRAFRRFASLLIRMRELKALEPAMYAEAEADMLSAREIAGDDR